MVQFVSYLRRVLRKTRLIFPRINGPNVQQLSLNIFTNYGFILFLFLSFLDTSGSYHHDPRAFLFSLVNYAGWAPLKLPQTGKHSSLRKSIRCHSLLGPTFGGGYDMSIFNARSNSNTYSDLGHTYSPPGGYSYRSSFARTFLAGTYKFTPDEVETFYETT